MLDVTDLFVRDGIAISDIGCRHGRGKGEEEAAPGWAICFVRRGCFVRWTSAGVATLDPSMAFFVKAVEGQRYDHPHDGGDDCTAFFLDEELLASVFGGEPDLPTAPIHTSPGLDLGHRSLLSAIKRQASDETFLFEEALNLASQVLRQSDATRVRSGEPGRRRTAALVAEARESLAADPGQSLSSLSRNLAVSPHHLSRIFSRATGHTIARHKMRLRTRAALERLAVGEDNLARLAADLGFVDQSHLSRVVRSETGTPPSLLRDRLRRD